MPNNLMLNRAQIAKIAQGVPQTISALENLVSQVGGFPSTIEEANALAGAALAVAQAATAALTVLADALAQLETAPATPQHIDPDDTMPRAHLGTISAQNHDQVEITGGTVGVDAGMASQTTLYFGGDKATGLYRSAASTLAIATGGSQRGYFDSTGLGVWGSVSASGQLISTIAAGTPPLVVTSTTKVPNLYVDRAAQADHATTADGLTSPSSYPADATDLPTVIALANALKAACTSKGV